MWILVYRVRGGVAGALYRRQGGGAAGSQDNKTINNVQQNRPQSRVLYEIQYQQSRLCYFWWVGRKSLVLISLQFYSWNEMLSICHHQKTELITTESLDIMNKLILFLTDTSYPAGTEVIIYTADITSPVKAFLSDQWYRDVTHVRVSSSLCDNLRIPRDTRHPLHHLQI